MKYLTTDQFLHMVYEESKQLDPNHHKEYFDDAEDCLKFEYTFENFSTSRLGQAIALAFAKSTIEPEVECNV